MLFQTSEFAVFFVLVSLLYFLKVANWRWLLVATTLSIMITAGETRYALAALVVLGFDGFCQRALGGEGSTLWARRSYCAVNLLLLAALFAMLLSKRFFVAECESLLSAEFSGVAVTLTRDAVLLYLCLAAASTIQLYVDPGNAQQHLGWMLLLPASYYFYMSWHPIYALLILYSTVVDYIVSQKMQRLHEANGVSTGLKPETKRKWALILLGLFVALGLSVPEIPEHFEESGALLQFVRENVPFLCVGSLMLAAVGRRTYLAYSHATVTTRLRVLLLISLVGNLGLLFFYKYENFFARTVNAVIGPRTVALHDFLLPVGISFYTFQTLSYTIEVFRGRQQAERHFGYFATYVVFFPQLVAGPIERPQNLLPELRRGIPPLEYTRITNGMKLFAWGFFKKIVIADRLATLVDPVYNDVGAHPDLLGLATLAFGIQIYCDFSGYSDMAIGSAQILGVKLMKNFQVPYRAKSIQDFWRRWHISLSTWFKDYVYKPICRRWGFTTGVKVAAAVAVFLLSGLWHGANWTFVIWGAIFAVLYVVERLAAPVIQRTGDAVFGSRTRLRGWCAVATTYLVVNFAWIFFRANSVQDALTVVSHIPGIVVSFVRPGATLDQLHAIGWGWYQITATIVGLFTLWFVHNFQEQGCGRDRLADRPIWQRHLAYQWLVWVCILFGVYDEVQFIYFQF